MSRRSPVACIVAALVVALPLPALAAPPTTVTLTIQDTDDDRLLEHAPGEPYVVIGRPQAFRPPRHGEIAFNDYSADPQNNGGAKGEPGDRNVIIVLDKPWPARTE